MLRLTFLALSLFASTSAAAQSSFVGLEGTTLEIESTGAVDLAASYFITHQHGLQLDLAVDHAAETWLARVGAHLYLIPAQDHRYGVFVQFSDLDDAPIWAIAGGLEGVWRFGASTVGVRAGAGLARPGELDYLFANASWRQSLTETYSFTASASVQEFDETNLSAIGAQAEIALEYHLRNAPLVLTVGYKADTLSGYAPSATSFVAASFTFGQKPSFGRADPLASLWSRGLVGN